MEGRSASTILLLIMGQCHDSNMNEQVTKQALSSRVVDSEETGRHFSENELKKLFEFTPGKTTEDIATADGSFVTDDADNPSKMYAGNTLPPQDVVLARVMSEMLPKWIVGYHEADSLVQVLQVHALQCSNSDI